jgi:hypothetical protein
MGLLEDLASESNFPRPRRAWCSVCILLNKLSDKERLALQQRLDDKNVTHVALSTVLKNNGYEIGESVVGRHRRKICQSAVK